MVHNQTTISQNAGFTLVEIMVVIVIISILVLVGNYADFTQRREKTRIEEIALQITSMIDQEKIDTLLGKTEGGEIVRKRKITLGSNDTSGAIDYATYINLVKDAPTSYTGTASTTKNWTYPTLKAKLYNCDNTPATAIMSSDIALNIELIGDTMGFLGTSSSYKHLVIVILYRDTISREIHIDRRTGVIYEREKTSPSTDVPLCI